MAADNNLNDSAENDLESLRRGSYNSEIEVIVQLDRFEFIDTMETIRYHIKDGILTEHKRIGETNMGDPRVLKNFIEESAKEFPSEKLVVVIWSHGTGVDDYNFYEAKRERYFVPKEEIEMIAIAVDDSAKDFLDNIELQKALDVSVKIDVLGFDACLMGMFEIAYQLKNQADVLVASQYLEPVSGWNYPRILEELKVEQSADEMGSALVEFYADYYERQRYSVTQSALKLAFIEEVAQDLDAFAKILLENLESRTALKLALLSSQLFGRSDYVDLRDFVLKVQNRLEIEILEPFISKLLTSLQRLIVANWTLGNTLRDAHGISVYFPTQKRPFKETFEKYEQLDFSKEYPHWIALIRWYYKQV